MKYKYIPLLLCTLLLTACGQEHRLSCNPEEPGKLAESMVQEISTETEYFYDAQDRVTREIVRSTYLDGMLYDTMYGYDEAGRRLELTSDHSDSEVSVHLWYGYVYFY